MPPLFLKYIFILALTILITKPEESYSQATMPDEFISNSRNKNQNTSTETRQKQKQSIKHSDFVSKFIGTFVGEYRQSMNGNEFIYRIIIQIFKSPDSYIRFSKSTSATFINKNNKWSCTKTSSLSITSEGSATVDGDEITLKELSNSNPECAQLKTVTYKLRAGNLAPYNIKENVFSDAAALLRQ